MTARALIILHPGFEEIEAVTPIDLLSRADIEVVQAALDDQLLVSGRSGLTVRATHRLTEVAEQAFDAVIVPGGPGITQIRQHALICKLLQRQHASGKLIACICAAPLLLLDAALHHGLRYTCHPQASAELCAALPSAVVQHHNIITARGAGTATEFALQLVAALASPSSAAQIAESICYPTPR